MPALSRIAASALAWSSAEITGLRTRRRRSSLSSSMRLKRSEIALDLVELPLVLGKLEERGGIAPRHARHHRIVGCHVNALAREQTENCSSAPRRPGQAKRACRRCRRRPHSRAPRIAWAAERSNPRACVWNAAGKRGHCLRHCPQRRSHLRHTIRVAESDRSTERQASQRSRRGHAEASGVQGEVLPSKTSQEEFAHVHMQASYCRSALWRWLSPFGPARSRSGCTDNLAAERSPRRMPLTPGAVGVSVSRLRPVAAGDRAHGSGSAPAS